MKKIILVLMFSLVSAVNADGVCRDKYLQESTSIQCIAGYIVENECVTSEKSKQLSTTLYNLMFSRYVKEFKIDNKESICAYMIVYDLSFLNTQLTQDDIEQFERYMAENDNYEKYERNKKNYTQTLKFFTYYRNHISSYKTKSIDAINGVTSYINNFQKYNGEIDSARYVYGKRQGNSSTIYDYSFDDFKNRVARETTCNEATANSKEELAECAKNKEILFPILKWAESNMKQKGGQK